MILCNISLGQVSDFVSIGTPLVLLAWFYYSQRQTLSKNYFEQIDGIYAGFTEPLSYSSNGKRIYGGIETPPESRGIDN